MKTDKKPAATAVKPQDQAAPEKDRAATEKPHTELRAVGEKPRPRSKIMPPELRDDDDLFNDMPV